MIRMTVTIPTYLEEAFARGEYILALEGPTTERVYLPGDDKHTRTYGRPDIANRIEEAYAAL